MLYKLSTGDEVHRYQKSIVVQFKDDRKVLSTSFINGGYNENLKYVFNHDCNPGAGLACKLRADTYAEHMSLVATELGLDPEKTAGISTAASMENVSIKTESYRDVTVTAIVTGGIEVNGGRAGDPASYYENQGEYVQIKPGTINIILYIDADMPAESMTRALVTCTEAKTAAIQELMAGSNYSRGLATGSGTDGTIVVSNSKSNIKLLHAGKHAKLGELIGVAVKKSVKEALYLQTGLDPHSQYSMLRRTKRFGVNEEVIWNRYEEVVRAHSNCENFKSLTKPEFIHNLHTTDTNSDLVMLTSLYVHLLDQLDWKLLGTKQVIEEGGVILNKIREKLCSKEITVCQGHSNIELDANLKHKHPTHDAHDSTHDVHKKTHCINEQNAHAHEQTHDVHECTHNEHMSTHNSHHGIHKCESAAHTTDTIKAKLSHGHSEHNDKVIQLMIENLVSLMAYVCGGYYNV